MASQSQAYFHALAATIVKPFGLKLQNEVLRSITGGIYWLKLALPVLDSKRGPHARLANLMRACGPLFILSLVRSSLNLKHGP